MIHCAKCGGKVGVIGPCRKCERIAEAQSQQPLHDQRSGAGCDSPQREGPNESETPSSVAGARLKGEGGG